MRCINVLSGRTVFSNLCVLWAYYACARDIVKKGTRGSTSGDDVSKVAANYAKYEWVQVVIISIFVKFVKRGHPISHLHQAYILESPSLLLGKCKWWQYGAFITKPRYMKPIVTSKKRSSTYSFFSFVPLISTTSRCELNLSLVHSSNFSGSYLWLLDDLQAFNFDIGLSLPSQWQICLTAGHGFHFSLLRNSKNPLIFLYILYEIGSWGIHTGLDSLQHGPMTK